MKLLFLCAIVSVSAKTLWHQLEGYSFKDYCQEYEKVYSKDEYVYRNALFEKKLQEIKKHNKKISTWKKGVNKFSDLTREEFKARYTGYARMSSQVVPSTLEHVNVNDVPTSIDWRKKNVVTAVKNQGSCGSCWSFAATETIESALAIKTGKLIVLSEQNMVSCTENPRHCGGTGGCQGATAELGMGYVAEKGISSEADYPYRAVTGVCEEKKKAAKIGNFTKLAENKYLPFYTALGTIGPIAISVCADFADYENGVYDGCLANCVIDHGVQAVGYGKSLTGTDYWLVRNSWGALWGDEGYISLKRFGTDDAFCGTDNRTHDGSACEGDPSSATICGMCGILYDTVYPTDPSLV